MAKNYHSITQGAQAPFSDMNKDDLKKFRETLDMSQQDISLLFGLAQPAWNRYEKGSRPIPEYIQRSIEFFQALSKRAQQQFINKARPDGEQSFATDSKPPA